MIASTQNVRKIKQQHPKDVEYSTHCRGI